MNDYKVGSSHPDLHPGTNWYLCHPATGLKSISAPLRTPNEVTEWRDRLGEAADELEEKFTSHVVRLFTQINPDSKFIFYGAYEDNERTILNEAGLDSEFNGTWVPAFNTIVTNVNVHEFVLTANTSKLVIYEDWSNVYMTFDNDESLKAFSVAFDES